MADHFQKISAKVMNWWPYILLNFVLFHFVYATPVNTPMQLPGYPQQIHYVGDKPLPGGQLQSLLNGNFTPDQIVTGSGPAGNSAFTGTAGGFSLLGNSVVKAGEALGSLCSSLVTGVFGGAATILSGLLGWGRVNTNVVTYNSPPIQ